MKGASLKRRQKWSEERVESELRLLAERIGHFPTTSELKKAGRNDLVGAAGRRGGLRLWARKLGYEPNRAPGELYWTDERIRETLRPFLVDREISFPTRREFEDVGLSSLWQVLQDRGELGRWAREFRLKEPQRGRPPKRR